jgi:thioredoxin reductase
MAIRADAVIVGGGPAGLSAALVLGRCRRDVVVFDDRRYRNASAVKMKGFITRDHIPPQQFRELAYEDLKRYPTVRVRHETVIEAKRVDHGFALLLQSGEEVYCGALLLATGFIDSSPTIAGARELHGELVVPCPYCDAYEVRDQPIAAFSTPDETGARFAFLLGQWSKDVVFCADRRPQISDGLQARLADRGVRVEHRELRSIEREGDGIRLIFSEGESLWRRMMFYHLGGKGNTTLARHLGATVDERGSVDVDRRQETSVPGLWVAGDATRDVLQAIVAAGEGAAAAVSMNEYLCGGESHGKSRVPNL